MFISTKSLMAAAGGNYEDIPEEDRELVRLRLETKKRYTIKAEANQKVRAEQYIFYTDTVICAGMVRGGEEIVLLPSFRLAAGALADQLHELLPEANAHTEAGAEGPSRSSETPAVSEDEGRNEEPAGSDVAQGVEPAASDFAQGIKLAESDFTRSVTLADFDPILKSFAAAKSLPYLSPSEADFSVFAKGTDGSGFLYAFTDQDRTCLYLGRDGKLSVSRCRAESVFSLLLGNLFRMHREEILAMNREEG